MSLREQFEAWLAKNYPGIVDRWVGDPEGQEEAMWLAYQAGHASGRDDLLEACEAALGCDTEMEGVDSSLPKWLKEQLQAAIKKARGEA